MIWDVPEILHELSKLYALSAGDLVFMGTPAGRRPAAAGRRLRRPPRRRGRRCTAASRRHSPRVTLARSRPWLRHGEDGAWACSSEFKEFIARGNVVDLAVAVVIGAAFGKIVTALVDGIVMPIVGVVTGGVERRATGSTSSRPTPLDAAGKARSPEVAIKYGMFIQTLIDFVLIAFVIFLVLKAYNRMRKPAEPRRPRRRKTCCCCARSAIR